ncbi:MAG: Na+/H+ antiporter NhaC family protein [Gemmatimonadaceae bacterium]
MSSPLEFRGRLAGALAPFALFLTGVGWLALSGAPDEKGFWPILLAALALGLALAKDRTRYSEAVLAAMAQPVVMLMIMAWLLSGVLAVLLNASGFVEALVWGARALHLTGAAYVAAAFLTCGVVSTATGTSFGTIMLAGPLLYPAGGALAAPPAVLMGAILAGATFGDSISPVSDTTIASAGSQLTDVPGTVRARLTYVLPAGALALAASVVLAMTGTPVLGSASATTAAAGAAVASAGTGGARALAMLLVPAIVITLLVRKRHLLEGLFAGIALSLALGLALGLLDPAKVFYIDRTAFGAKGLIIDGLSRGLGVSVFTILLIGLVGALQESSAVEGVLAWARTSTLSPRRAEAWIVGSVTVAVLLTTHSVVAMLTVGAFTREVGARAGLSAYRRANLLDMTVCTLPFILPYFLPTILASSASASGADFGMPRVAPFAAGLHNTYAWALVVAVALAVVTGWGRTADGRRETGDGSSVAHG